MKICFCIAILGFVFCIVGCNAADKNSLSSLSSVSSNLISSNLISSNLISSDYIKVSSEISKDSISDNSSLESISSEKIESDKSGLVEVPPISSKANDKTSSQMNDEKLQEENSAIVNSFVNFVIINESGNFVDGVKTRFNFLPPNGTSSKVDFDLSAHTDSFGQTSVQLHEQDLDEYIVGVDIDRISPFKAIISAPDGNTYEILAEKLKNANYSAKINSFRQKGFQILIEADQTYTFNVVIEEVTE